MDDSLVKADLELNSILYIFSTVFQDSLKYHAVKYWYIRNNKKAFKYTKYYSKHV